MAYTNFTNCTASEYKNIIYNQETDNKIKILFNNVELEDADEYCESFEVVSKVIPNGSKIFMLENLVSQEATLVLHNIDTSIIQDQVSISIGTLVSENTYEYVPIGIYNLQEIPTTDNGKTTIKLRDNSVKLDFNYNAKPLIDQHGGTATKLQILQDICTKAGITCNVASFIGSSDLIGIYDNTITGRQYVSYLAGSAGAIPIITRTGALDFKYLNNLSIIQIPIEIVEQYSNAENFKISRVVYEDAIRKYESGNETYDTLFLDSANPYISSQEQVASIYNIVNNFEINSFTTGRILGNPAIDAYDLIQITDYDGTIFKTFANNTLKYNGKMINTFASEISFERKKENVSLKSGATFKKWAKTEIDNVNAEITLQAGQIEEIENDLSNPTTTLSGTSFDIEDALDQPLQDFKMYGDTQQDSTTGINLAYDITEYGKFAYLDIVSGKQYTIAVKLEQQPSNTNIMYTGAIPNISGSPAFSRTYKTWSATTPVGTLMYYNITALQTGKIKVETFGQSGGTPRYTDIMIVEGTYTDQTLPAYEPYTNGASPNPTYPQEIHNVSGDNTIEICGKNLFNKSDITTGKRLDGSGNLINGTDYFTTNYYIPVQPNTTYYCSQLLNQSKCVCLYDNSKTFIERLMYLQTHTFTTGNTTHFIKVSLLISDIDTTQIEKGSTATEYEAYKGISQEINLGKNLLDVDKTQFPRTTTSFTATIDDSGIIHVTGVKEDSTTWENIPIVPLKTMIFKKGVTYVSPDGISVQLYTVGGAWVGNMSGAFTPTGDWKSTYCYWAVKAAGTYDRYIHPQVEVGSVSTTYSPYFTPIELNKIGNYQDYIYKTDKWYWHKEYRKYYLKDLTFTTEQTGSTGIYRLLSSEALSDILKPTGNTTTIEMLCTHYDKKTANNTYNKIQGISISQSKKVYIYDENYNTSTSGSDYNTWVSNNNPYFIAQLETPQEIEITDTTLLEQLDNLMTIPLIKDLTHIIITPNDLTPTLDIEYLRDTSINENFVRQPQLNNYYTRVETDAQIEISSNQIQSTVSELQTQVDSNGDTISSVSNQVQTLQSSTSLQIDVINQQLENGVEKVTNSLVKIDTNGINTSRDDETFNTQITNKTFEVRDGTSPLVFVGYKVDEQRTVAQIPELEARQITAGVHRTEIIEEDNELWTADYYIGDGS